MIFEGVSKVLVKFKQEKQIEHVRENEHVFDDVGGQWLEKFHAQVAGHRTEHEVEIQAELGRSEKTRRAKIVRQSFCSCSSSTDRCLLAFVYILLYSATAASRCHLI